MGKVRKLRKKYKALCNKSKEPRPQAPSKTGSIGSTVESPRVPDAFQMDVEPDNISTARSSYSISKSIKSSLGGMSILKKDKQKLRHALFMQRLDASKMAFENCRTKRKKVKRIDFKDELPPLKIPVGRSDDSQNQSKKIETKNANKPCKGMMKLRHKSLAHNVNAFREILKKKDLTVE